MFVPTRDVVLDMTPTEFENHALQVLRQNLQGLKNCIIEHNKIVEVSDGNYQIDGYIEFELMSVKYKTLIECKHYKTSISREKVQVLYDKLRACGAQKGILVSSSNFQSGAIRYATEHGIALIQLTEAGNQYFTRSEPGYGVIVANNRVPYNNGADYIGVLQKSPIKEGIINTSYLTDYSSALHDFLTT